MILSITLTIPNSRTGDPLSLFFMVPHSSMQDLHETLAQDHVVFGERLILRRIDKNRKDYEVIKSEEYILGKCVIATCHEMSGQIISSEET